MENCIIGYTAASVSVVAFGAQFVHTVRCGTVEGLSVSRAVLDAISLSLWVLYATRTEDHPLLIATSFELLLSICVCVVVMKHQMGRLDKSLLPVIVRVDTLRPSLKI